MAALTSMPNPFLSIILVPMWIPAGIVVLRITDMAVRLYRAEYRRLTHNGFFSTCMNKGLYVNRPAARDAASRWCSGSRVLRHAGQAFWGCSGFPHCHYTRQDEP